MFDFEGHQESRPLRQAGYTVAGWLAGEWVAAKINARRGRPRRPRNTAGIGRGLVIGLASLAVIGILYLVK